MQLGAILEHYRPKKKPINKDIQHECGYYWLAYSWDNLLLACQPCNVSKSARFPIEGQKKNYENEAFEDIHTLGATYDAQEQPLIINPETF